MLNINDYNSVTVVIVLFKESFDLISRTLKKIKDYKIIIIDNANNHHLKKKILENYKIYKYLLNEKNNGFSAGYNQGIKLSSTKFTLVLGPDCLIKSWVFFPRPKNPIVKVIAVHFSLNNVPIYFFSV